MSSPLFRVLAFRAYAAASMILLVPLTLYLLWVAPLFGLGLIVVTLVVQRIYGRYRLPEEAFSEIKDEYLKAGKALTKAELAYANIHKRSEASSDEHPTKCRAAIRVTVERQSG